MTPKKSSLFFDAFCGKIFQRSRMSNLLFPSLTQHRYYDRNMARERTDSVADLKLLTVAKTKLQFRLYKWEGIV